MSMHSHAHGPQKSGPEDGCQTTGSSQSSSLHANTALPQSQSVVGHLSYPPGGQNSLLRCLTPVAQGPKITVVV